MADSVIKTEISLGEQSIRDVLSVEMAKILQKEPEFFNTFVNNLLFSRPPKKNSYDSELPTFYESALRKTLQPFIEEEMKVLVEEFKPKIDAILRSVFKNALVDTTEFKDRLSESLGKYLSRLRIYPPD